MNAAWRRGVAQFFFTRFGDSTPIQVHPRLLISSSLDHSTSWLELDISFCLKLENGAFNWSRRLNVALSLSSVFLLDYERIVMYE